MAKQMQLKPHTLEDPIVLESIKGINLIKQEKKIKGHIAGGMAVQSYLPKELNRPTIDVDFRLFWHGSKGDFSQVVQPLEEHLKAKGYYVLDPIKQGMTYDINISKEGDSLLLQHQKVSQGNFEKIKTSLERELSNQRIIQKNGLFFAVMSPEDIVTHKMSRILSFIDRHKLSFSDKFYDLPVEAIRREADALREDITSHEQSPSESDVAKVRVLYDCVDIKNLANYAGLNKHYLLESFMNWQYLSGKPSTWLFEGLDFVGINLLK